MKSMVSKTKIVTSQIKIVVFKAIPVFNSYTRSIKDLQKNLSKLENEKKIVAEAILSKFPEFGIYQDRTTEEAIEIYNKVSKNQSYKNVVNELRGFIELQLEMEEETRQALMSFIANSIAKNVGLETFEKNVQIYKEK